MRVLILLDSLNLGGAEKQALLLADWLQDKKDETVEVWAFTPGDGSAESLCDRYGVTTQVIGPFRGFRRYLFIRQIFSYARLFGQFRPDVVMGFTNRPNLLLGLTWKQAGARCFIWGQQGIETTGPTFVRRTDRTAIRNTPVFVSNSRNGAEYLIAHAKAPKDKVHIIANGPEEVEPEFTRSEWRRKLGIGEGQFVALMVAHIARRKDHETLLKAWKRVSDVLSRSGEPPILLLAGNPGDGTQKLLSLAIELEILAQIRFLGHVDDVVGLNLAADLHVLSSVTEGLPNALLEAMRWGLPVVGTDIPGIREALGDGSERFLSEPQNDKDLAEKILALATQPELAREAGRKNKRRVETHFKLEDMCQAHYELMTR